MARATRARARAGRLARYRLEEALGHGGMAVVHRGWDEELDRPVAIKVLAENLAQDDSFRRRFLREARVAAALAHPNIVKVYDSGELDGRLLIVMEYVEGDTLREFLERRGRIPADEAVELAVQICAGLEHAHSAGLVHRDIKPHNLLLRRDGLLKIADFGIAHVDHGSQLTEVGTILGTASYLAPEQAAGEPVTASTDIYANGVVLYELLTGRQPRTYESVAELLADGDERPPAPVSELAPDVPPAVEAVVMKCLARMPEYRPPTAAALGQQLERALAAGNTAPTAAATTEVYAPRKPVRARRPWMWVAAVAAFAALALVLAIALSTGGGKEQNPAPAQPAPAAAKPKPPAAKPKPPAEQARDLAAWLRRHSR